MKALVLLIASAVVLIGLTGVVLPEGITRIGEYVATPVGLYVVAVLRVAIGFILIQAAPGSRYPTVLRVLGIVIMIAGFATPLFGVERSRAMLDWWSGLDPTFRRAEAGLAIVIGAFIAYAVSPSRRSDRQMADTRR